MLTVYSSNTTSFSNLGIGALKDFTSNPLITEELNGAYTLEFSYAKDGYLSEYLVEQNIIKANGQPFRIWNVKKDMKSITILAKHIFFDLSFNFLADVYPKNLTSQGALAWLISHAQTPTNFTVSGNCTVVSNARYVRKNIVDAIYNEDNALLERFGGELSFDNFAITVNETRGTNANFSIRYKKNLVGIDFNLDFSNVATRIIPIGFDGITIDSLYVESPKVGNYFTPLYKTYEFSNIKYDPDDEEAYHTLEEAKQALTSAANDLFNKDVDIPQISVKVNFVELSKCTEYESYSNLETVHLGDTIDVIVPELNIKTKARVVKTVYDCILKRFTTLEIGNVTPSATTNQIEVNNQVKKTENYINEAQKNAENLINHPFKGNLYIDSTPGSGVIYFMDTTNPATAQSIWKWSIGGLGYSPNGINGTYTIGITQDGKINADFITTGHLNTSVIEGYDSLVIQVNQNTNNLIPTDSLESSDNTYHFEDSAESNLVNFEMDGKSTQETTTGKNKLPNTFTTGTINGITFTKNTDGTITVNGTATAETSINVGNDSSLTVGTSYTLTGTPSGASSTTYRMGWNYHGYDYGSGLTSTKDSNVRNIQINVMNGATLNNITFKPMIRLASISDNTYEPYTGGQPSPNPDYPQEIESVGYENLFDKGGNQILEAFINGTTGVITNYNATRMLYIECKPNTTYAFSRIGGTRLIIGTTNVIPAKGIIVNDIVTDNNAMVKTYTTSSNAKYLCVFYYNSGSDTLTEENIRNSIQITKSIIPLPYISYGKYGIEYKTVGKNLLKISGNTTTINGITFTQNSDGSIRVSGTATANAEYISTTLQPITPNTRYRFSGCPSGGSTSTYRQILRVRSNLTTNIATVSNTTNDGSDGNVAPLENAHYVLGEIIVYSGQTIDKVFYPQLEKGNQATPYEPYQEKTTLIQLDEPLRSIGNVKDKLRIENNTLYVDRYIGRVVFNGSESWRNDAGTVGDDYRHNIKFQDIQLPNSATRKNGLSNYFHSDYVTRDGIWEKGEFYCNGEWIVIWDKNQNYNLNNFKSWLSTHPTEVIYQLAEPTTEVVGEMKLPTLLNTNNIDIYSNLITDSSLTYTRNVDLANYINNQIVSSEASIKVTTDSIQSQVSSNAEGLNSAVTTLTEQGLDIDILHTNIDREGNVTEVTTSNKHFSLNNDGLTITGNEGFKAIQNETGTYYYNGNDITGQYTKDGSLQKDLYLFGSYRYGMDDINDTPMFVGQKYTKVVNGTARQVFGHFINK